MICSLRVGDVECDALRRVPLLSSVESLPMPFLGSGAIFERRLTESISTSPYAASTASHTGRIMGPGRVISDVSNRPFLILFANSMLPPCQYSRRWREERDFSMNNPSPYDFSLSTLLSFVSIS
jgi:hypothetical protein